MTESADSNGIESRVIDFLENAIASTNESEKVQFLNQAQELVIHNDILDNFLDEILGFQSDKFSEVRKFVVGFIEASCKKEPDYFPKVIVNLSMMLADEVPNVLKKVIQTLTQLYKIFLLWIFKTKVTDESESTWEVWNQIKNQVFSMLDLTENDGVRTQCVKFIEMVIVCQTRRDNFSKEEEFSLDEISSGDNKLIDVETMEDEAKQLFEQLVNFQAKIHISSVNLMATMQSLSLLAKQRSKLFFNKVVLSFEHLSLNLPPTLAKSQVNSVHKQLKLLLFTLLKHPYVTFSKHQSKLSQILLNIGVKQNEINRCLQEGKKRSIKAENHSIEPKRIKLEIDDDDDEQENGVPMEEPQQPKLNLDHCLHQLSKRFSRYDAIKAADITAKDLSGRLGNLNTVCDIVLASIHLLPDDVDSNLSLREFSFSHNEPAAIAKKMSLYLTSMGSGPGIDEILNKYVTMFENLYKIKVDSEMQKKIMSSLKKNISKELKNQQQNHGKLKLTQSGKTMTSAAKIKQFKLEEITKPLDLNEKLSQMEKCVARILVCDQTGHLSARQYENYRKIIGKLSTEFLTVEPLKSLIKEFIFRDIRSRYDILFSAIYQEYIDSKVNCTSLRSYSDYLQWLIENILDIKEPKDRYFFLQKLYLESPYLDDNVIMLLKKFVQDSDDFETSTAIVKMLIEKRPAYREEFLSILLEMSIESTKPETNDFLLGMIKDLYQNPKLKLEDKVESFAVKCLHCLEDNSNECDEEKVKILLSLYFQLLPINQKLIHELPKVYVASSAPIKRIILRLIQDPIQAIDMDSPEMIKFVVDCIEGAETLVSRVIHILTEKRFPSTQLIVCVKDLYKKRVSDVRFLIPVLNGFTKKEIIEILPQLIKLNPNVVKEVFNRLFISHDPNHSSAIAPSDLLIALHNMDTSKCDLKTIIKVTNLCFEEKNIFTGEVWAVVMQLLIDQSPLPTLLMRTVIQTLTHYPRLVGFVLNNILQRLLHKQVWEQKKVWEGFIKCCQRTAPQSFQILLQLAPPQLRSVFETCPEIRPALVQYIQSMTEEQVQLIPSPLLDVILMPQEIRRNDKNGSEFISNSTENGSPE